MHLVTAVGRISPEGKARHATVAKEQSLLADPPPSNFRRLVVTIAEIAPDLRQDRITGTALMGAVTTRRARAVDVAMIAMIYVIVAMMRKMMPSPVGAADIPHVRLMTDTNPLATVLGPTQLRHRAVVAVRPDLVNMTRVTKTFIPVHARADLTKDVLRVPTRVVVARAAARATNQWAAPPSARTRVISLLPAPLPAPLLAPPSLRWLPPLRSNTQHGPCYAFP